MNRKLLIGILIFATLGVFVFENIAQYTGNDIEQMKPPDPYPKPGPGEIAIVRELQETNRLLQQQTELLKDQNRLLKDALLKLERSPSQ